MTVDASEFIEEITLDPRLGPDQQQMRLKGLREMEFGGAITFSELYRTPLLAFYEELKPLPPAEN